MPINIVTTYSDRSLSENADNSKNIRRSGLFFFLAIALILLLFMVSSSYGGLVSVLVYYDIYLMIFMLVGILSCLIMGIWYYLQYDKLRKRFDAIGSKALMSDESETKTKRRLTLPKFIFFISVINMVAVFMIIILTNRQFSSQPPKQYGGEIDFPLVEQIAPDEWVTFQQTYAGGSNEIYSVEERSCFIAPKIIKLRQYSLISDYNQDDNGKGFGYNVDYYEMRTINLAIKFEEELCKYANTDDLRSINVNGYESAFYYLDRDGENLILRAGNKIINVMYYGSGSLMDSIHLF